ncbi:hypothetical protein CJ030_MR6G013203 [Morella rubra]|uniref:DUF4283 domain-containing protein n=1 Tax=Morella rubra TaxID=262757 RepID=A0A6A1VBB1_9ROSI|nr:hypothetical protein CJ030_MR6G013203 [Morella rubra]
MSTFEDEVALLTRRTEALSWDSLPQRLSMDLDSALQHSSRVFIGKLFGLQPPAKSVFLNILHTVWKFAVDLQVEAMANSMYNFHFSHCEGKDRVMNMVPWNFKGHLLLLQHLSPEMTLDEIDLSFATF